MAEDWQTTWQPMIDAIGTDFGGGVKHLAAEDVERATVRRFCEPLEMDCPLYYDEEVAKANGYGGIPAPLSGVSQTWTDPGVWRPGQPTRYVSSARDSAVVRDPREGGSEPPMPGTSAAMATDLEVEFFEDAIVGDRLYEMGDKIIAVTPKETAVGRGAFVTRQWEVRNQDDVLIGQVRRTIYSYVPFEK